MAAGLKTRKKQRLVVLSVAVTAFVGAATLLIFALGGDSFALFRQPSDLQSKPVAEGQRIRLGGLVQDGSFERLSDGISYRFTVTDCVANVLVTYSGLLPDLFREGQGVVTEGTMNADGTMAADTVLAKHDENYVPKGTVPKNADACTHPENVATYGEEKPAVSASTAGGGR